MIYILVFVLLVGICTYVNQRTRINAIRRNGVKATGLIINNRESGSRDKYRLGGNINDPIIEFTTKEGLVIRGKPVVGFVTQHEVAVPTQVPIVYNLENPKEFYIDNQ